ncbi:MAG: 30S ribosomal protein S5 [Phycisphaerae bacterium]|nr:30S ribosomal protein S5 [Phycisphaerae bacterium]
MPELLDEKTSIESTTIGVYRTSATVKGGRRFSFGAIVVVGDKNGRVGFGYAKGNEVPNAIEKAQKDGQKKLVGVRRVGTTIHHEVEGKFSSAKVRLIPAAPGSGVVAGTVVRAVLELAGISDCLTKCYGSTNPQNVLKAVFDAIDQLRTPEMIASLRGQKLETSEIEKKIEAGKAFLPAARKSDRPKGPVNTLGQDRPGRGRGGRGGPRGGGGGGGGDRGGRGGDASAPAPAAPSGGAPAGEAPAAS